MSHWYKVKLEPDEVELAGYVGMRRQSTSIARGSKPRFPERNAGELWAHHIMGAHAELAVAKALPAYWNGSNCRYHVPDIPFTNFEVRWSMREDLKVRPDDEGIVIGVRGVSPLFHIVGWIKAADAKKREWEAFKNSANPAYFVPYEHLHPFEELLQRMQAMRSKAQSESEPPSPPPEEQPPPEPDLSRADQDIEWKCQK